LVIAGNIMAVSPKNQDGMVSTFSNDGSFMSYASMVDSGDYLGDYYWNLDANGVYQGAPADGFWYCADGGVRWGWNGANQILVAPSGGGDLGPADFDRYVVVDGRVPVLMSNRGSQARFYVKNSWSASPTLKDVLDISKTGIARMWKSPAKENIPAELGFWTNGKFHHLKTMVPDLPGTYQDWGRVSIPGMADQGTFILRMDSGHPLDPSACAVCLPCAVEDDVSEAVRLAYRDHEGDTVPFTGVDDVSITADKTDPSVHNKIWIMAPIGGEAAPNDVKIHIPVGTDNPMTLSGPNMAGTVNLTEDGQKIAIKGSGDATTDEELDLNLGTQTSLNAPIGIKAMKKRKVYVTVTPVGREKADGSVAWPKRLPDKERLAKYLNKTYLLQMNAEIDLTYKSPVPLRFSTMTQADLNLDPNKPENEKLKVYLPSIDGGTFDYMLNAPGGEQAAFDVLRDAGADINVYLVGGIATIVGWHLDEISADGYKTWSVGGANGISNRDTNSAWVSDTRFDVYPFDNDPPEEKANYERLQMRTTAHEMGHLIIKYGHPDDGAGAAPLPGTDHNERLMRSGGSKAILRGNRLVKGEWDEAEVWLSKLPDRTEQTQ
jgi:hypothetical protein